VPCPFDVQAVSKAEGDLFAFAFQFIRDSPVIDAMDRNPSTLIIVEETISFFLNLRDANCLNATETFSKNKVRQRLLLKGVNFHKDYVLRMLITQNCPAQEVPIVVQAYPV
jgi:hypothetical protein